MIDQLTIDHALPNCGKITYDGVLNTYTPEVGWDKCETGRVMADLLNWRSFMSFDTSVIPADATILAVVFKVRRRYTDPLGTPQTYRLKFSIGTFIGEELNGTAEEDEELADVQQGSTYDLLHANIIEETVVVTGPGGTPTYVEDQEPVDYGIDGALGRISIEPGGDIANGSDLEVSYTYRTPEYLGGTLCRTLVAKPADKDEIDLAAEGVNPIPLINRSGPTDVRIWDSSTKGTGDDSWGTNFNDSSSARCRLLILYEIIEATATGSGYASASATVTHSGEAHATGVGEAGCSAGLILSSGGGVAAGAGYAQAAAGLLLSSAQGEATGSGAAALSANLIASGVGDASGAGFCELLGGLLRGASGTAVGIGTARLVAGLLLSSASGTATGVGTAWASTLLPVPPLAVHELTASIAPVDSGTCALTPVDSRTCVPRRN